MNMDALLTEVVWTESEKAAADDAGTPYATHSGVLEIFGKSLRCYRLNTGMTVFDADDLHAFFSEVGKEMP